MSHKQNQNRIHKPKGKAKYHSAWMIQ